MGDFPNPYDTQTGRKLDPKEALMSILTNFFTLAPLKGYRTQLLGMLAGLTLIIQFLVGDKSLLDLIHLLPGILGGLGLATVGWHILYHHLDEVTPQAASVAAKVAK